MQPQQQIFQPVVQVFPQNPQNQNVNIILPRNNIQQIIQIENPNRCEKMSKFITGSTNIPITVFTILMLSFAYHICTVLFTYGFLSSYLISSSFFDFLFAIFIWSRMAIKIEITTSSVKYGYLCFVNLCVLSMITISFPIKRVWNFVLFETILIAINNKNNKVIKLFCWKISGITLIIIAIAYHIIFNFFNIISILFTIAYTFIYQKWLIYKVNISNEKIQSLENCCLINYFINKFKTFITLEEVLAKEQNQQGNNNNANSNINSSFIPNNMYPNYYSRVIHQNPNQAPIQAGVLIQQNPPVAQPELDINQSSSQYDLVNSK